jgi:hypothetical protein
MWNQTSLLQVTELTCQWSETSNGCRPCSHHTYGTAPRARLESDTSLFTPSRDVKYSRKFKSDHLMSHFGSILG